MDTEPSPLIAVRRHERYPARLPVRVTTCRGVSADTVTIDISLTGIRVLGGALELGLNERCRLRVWLPDTLEHVKVEARVTRLIAPPATPGVGLTFEGQGPRPRWHEFIERAARHIPAVKLQGMPEVLEHTLCGWTLEALESMAELDVFLGGIFIATSRHAKVGSVLRLTLVHPIDGSHLQLRTRVTGQRVLAERGLCVAFQEPATRLSARLNTFILRGLSGIDWGGTMEPSLRPTRQLPALSGGFKRPAHRSG